MKKLIKILVGLLVLVAITLVGAVLLLDNIVKHGVEYYGTLMLKAPVSVEKVKISLSSGRVEIQNLQVGNPSGFKGKYAMQLPSAIAQMQLSSIFRKKIVIQAIVAQAVDVDFEDSLQGGSNLSSLSANVDQFVADPSAKPGDGMRFELDDCVLTSVHVKAGLTEIGGRGAGITIPAIHLSNVGADSEGVTPAQLTQIILNQVVSDTTHAAQGEVTSIGTTARDKVMSFGDKVADRIGRIGKFFGN